MNQQICKNGINLLYCNNNEKYCYIEIWLNFGSVDDYNLHGISHLTEHLLASRYLDNIDLFAAYNLYGMTSKERIRIFTKINKLNFEKVFRGILKEIMYINPANDNFLYQKGKVLYEIMHMKKSKLLKLMEIGDKYVYSNEYQKNPQGTAVEVEKISIEDVRKNLLDNLVKYGCRIAVYGIDSLKQIVGIIDEEIKFNIGNRIYYPALNYDVEKEIIVDMDFNGKLIYIDMANIRKDRKETLVIAKWIEEYLFMKCCNLPIECKFVDFNACMYFVIYLPMDLEIDCEMIFWDKIISSISSKEYYLIKQLLRDKISESDRICYESIRWTYLQLEPARKDYLNMIMQVKREELNWILGKLKENVITKIISVK